MKNMTNSIIVSSCLLGECTKYNGGHNKNSKLMKHLEELAVIAVCPEELGGLSTPRPPAEIIGGDGFSVLERNAKVVNKLGKDVTEEFMLGANKTLEQCVDNNCKLAILKANSPSCGNKKIYDGTFSGNKIDGVGVTTALLLKNHIEIYSEEDLDELFKGNRK